MYQKLNVNSPDDILCIFLKCTVFCCLNLSAHCCLFFPGWFSRNFVYLSFLHSFFNIILYCGTVVSANILKSLVITFRDFFDHSNFQCQNTVISPNLRVRKFCGKAQFSHSFGRFPRNYAETVPFHKISTRKLVKITGIYAVFVPELFFYFFMWDKHCFLLSSLNLLATSFPYRVIGISLEMNANIFSCMNILFIRIV